MPSTSTARCDLMATPSTSKCAGGFGLDDGSDGMAATTKLGLVIGNVEHPNSPKNLSILGIYFGNDDRTNFEKKFGSIFAQLNQLKTVSLEIAGRKRNIPVQIPQIHFGTDGTPRFCSDFSLSTLQSSE
ncbi:hypothetical protein niasHT_010214 [Heterodera trifolii]|uniref:Uncharacterized protein n=1 Tax=Heterodera trifolii TaxID=157864 RepID=A0ABD2MFX2_9BILA